MTIDTIEPGHCYVRARKLLGELDLIREEMGRTKDARRPPEITGAAPRACYFQAIAIWHKAARLSDEVGIRVGRPAPAAPPVTELVPGHVYEMIGAALLQVEDVKQLLGLTRQLPDTGVEQRSPSHVLGALIEASRDLTRLLERPATPSDVHRSVALAAAYATRIANKPLQLVAFEHKRQPADCYAKLSGTLATLGGLIAKRGHAALAVGGELADVVPADCQDLAQLVVGELAFLHALTPKAAPVQPFEPCGEGHRLPSHVYQLAGTLDALLAAI